jgi:hypothetical protein
VIRPRLRAGAAGALGYGVLAPLVAAATTSSPRWSRTNYRARTVTLAAGPAVAGAAIVAAAGAAPSAAMAGGAAATLGLYDDLYGDSHARGLRGHVAALRDGRLTTGAAKLAGLVVAAVAASALDRRRVRHLAVDVVLVAGTANLVNLLDLRPGRALKATLTVALPLALAASRPGAVAAGVAGAAAVALPADLAERAMMGDCGANGLGALLGWSLSRGLPAGPRAAAAAAVVGLTLASERVSFTRVIEDTPLLAVVDAWGRRP